MDNRQIASKASTIWVAVDFVREQIKDIVKEAVVEVLEDSEIDYHGERGTGGSSSSGSGGGMMRWMVLLVVGAGLGYLAWKRRQSSGPGDVMESVETPPETAGRRSPERTSSTSESAGSESGDTDEESEELTPADADADD